MNQKKYPAVVIHIPHSSTVIPPEYRDQLVLSDDDLAAELVRMTDAYTDELFALASDTATTIQFPVSRLVLDPERFEDDQQESNLSVGRCCPLLPCCLCISDRKSREILSTAEDYG